MDADRVEPIGLEPVGVESVGAEPVGDGKAPESFAEEVARIRSRPGRVDPVAFGLGVATISDVDGTVLDTWFGTVNLDENHEASAIITEDLGWQAGPGTYALNDDVLAGLAARFAPVMNDGRRHPNAEVLLALADNARSNRGRSGSSSSGSGSSGSSTSDGAGSHGQSGGGVFPVRRVPVVTLIEDLEAAPKDAHDAYLRLHLLSTRKVKPHGLSLDGLFGLLANVVWTSLGPCDVASFDKAAIQLRARGVQ
ncbi:MAG TPA: tetrahydrodipicolinate N-succinyltransferase N-terminal domain-containing protein, partial [Microthrixaceae bacterium]|nr:tetrahydrodipicolinate N-succinyltransferase N-terminal domain-containing protein [Microthrixaceae bacterium]